MTRKRAPQWSLELNAQPRESWEQVCEADRQATKDFETRYRQVAKKRGWHIHPYN